MSRHKHVETNLPFLGVANSWRIFSAAPLVWIINGNKGIFLEIQHQPKCDF